MVRLPGGDFELIRVISAGLEMQNAPGVTVCLHPQMRTVMQEPVDGL